MLLHYLKDFLNYDYCFFLCISLIFTVSQKKLIVHLYSGWKISLFIGTQLRFLSYEIIWIQIFDYIGPDLCSFSVVNDNEVLICVLMATEENI